MPTKVLAVTFDCHDPARQAEFWAIALSYKVLGAYPVAGANAVLISALSPTQEGVWGAEDLAGITVPNLLFIEVPESKVVKNRVHLDLGPETSIEVEVERLVAAGARVLTTVQEPEGTDDPWIWTVMQDPEGNEFCVGEPMSGRA